MSLVKPNRPPFVTVEELAVQVEHGARLSVGGHHFARLPIAALRAVFQAGVRDLRYFAWAGGLPLELLLEADAVAEIDICFSSLDIFGLAPRFRQVAEAGSLPVRDWPALAMIQALRAREQNLPFMPLQTPAGSAMMERCPALSEFHDERTGRDIALVEARELDVLLLHAPRADAAGNVEVFGAQALDLVQVGAARKVLVTVEEIVPAGALASNGRQTIVARNRVTAIAKVEGGAYPCSCLPFYATDYIRVRELLEGRLGALIDGLALPQAGVPEDLRHAARVRARAIVAGPYLDGAVGADDPPSLDEIMAVRIARMMDNDSFASAGAVSPLANVAYRLAKATHAPDLFVGTLSCGHVDIAAGTMTLSLLETMDAETAVDHCSGDGTYSTFYQGGYVTHEIIGAAQVDARGLTNNIELTKPSGGKLRLPGQGGMSDVANMHRDYVVYVPRHSKRSLVDSVEVVSSGRGVLTDTDRIAAGYRPGDVWLVTNLCLFRYDKTHDQLVVVEIMPGASRDEIVEQTGFKVLFDPDCAAVVPPTTNELHVLRRQVDPLGIRRLEFFGAKERGALLDEILERDREGLRIIIAHGA
jgi:glutaconate CoA-transferase subunit A